MSDKKLTIDDIEVPEEMLNAASSATPDITMGQFCVLRNGLQAALLYLAVHPIVPSEEQAREMYVDWAVKYDGIRNNYYACVQVNTEWQRRMFLKRESELPEELETQIRRMLRIGHTKKEATDIAKDIYDLGKKAGAK